MSIGPPPVASCRVLFKLSLRATNSVQLSHRVTRRKVRNRIETGQKGMTKISPLAPEHFPDLPPVAGVQLGTAEAGIKYRQRADVTVALLAPGTNAAGVFTRSAVPGAPVIWSRNALAQTSGKVRALVVNAGNANVFTGQEGLQASQDTAGAAAELFGCAPQEVMVSSTGVIGEPLNCQAIIDVLPGIALSESSWKDAASAIVTTDTFPKGAGATATIDGVTVTLNGIAKGSGMIAPNMATMLAYIFTDAAISAPVLDGMLRAVNETTFNAITVDSDTSTSDTVLLLATGAAGNDLVDDLGDGRLESFRSALEAVMMDLAHQVVRDGEGASKFITVEVAGAEDDAAAKAIAMSVANSPLMKTAIAGEDANWGRAVMAIGKAGARVDPPKLTISFGGVLVSKGGGPIEGYEEAVVSEHLKGDQILISIDLGLGSGFFRAWTCDLTHSYISINADYRS